MKFKAWLESAHPYNQQLDGPPLNPTTVAGAENQIRILALNIRNGLGRDARLNRQTIYQATQLLEKAAEMLDTDNLSGEIRNT